MKEVRYIDPIPTGATCILGADIGGTNSNFGFFILEEDKGSLKPILLLSLHVKSKTITDFSATVAELLGYVSKNFGMKVSRGCFAAAGVVSQERDYCKPTNLSFELRSQTIMKATGLSCAIIVNDFEVIGHGLVRLEPKKLIPVNEGLERLHANRIIIGAGTGLGKCTLVWDSYRGRYMPQASEGGHADFAAQHGIELELGAFIKKSENRICNISWEDVLSGTGIERIYHFFRQHDANFQANAELAKNGLHPDEIFKNKDLDQHSKHTYDLYTRLYARCVKNFVLDALALGGAYVAGGIAANNVPMFTQDAFFTEFINCGKQQELLKKVPVFVIADYNVSLYGAAEYMILEGLCG